MEHGYSYGNQDGAFWRLYTICKWSEPYAWQFRLFTFSKCTNLPSSENTI